MLQGFICPQISVHIGYCSNGWALYSARHLTSNTTTNEQHYTTILCCIGSNKHNVSIGCLEVFVCCMKDEFTIHCQRTSRLFRWPQFVHNVVCFPISHVVLSVDGMHSFKDGVLCHIYILLVATYILNESADCVAVLSWKVVTNEFLTRNRKHIQLANTYNS